MSVYSKHSFLALITTFILTGCTFATHIDKNRYWQMQDGITTLPNVSIEGNDGYVRYEEIFRQKQLFKEVVDKSDANIAIEIKTYSDGAENLAVSLSWLVLSGSSGYLIPYRGDIVRRADFDLYVDGQLARTYTYNDVKSTWIWFFALPLQTQENDEYFVEELMADQFVNSFIIDLLNDQEILNKIQRSHLSQRETNKAQESL